MSIDLEKLIAFLLALWGVASMFVALTPSTKDDELLTRLRAFLERLSFFQPKSSPGVFSMPGQPAAPAKPDELDIVDDGGGV